MTHLATADSDPAFARAAGRALPRGDRAVRRPDAPRRQQRGRAAAPAARFDAARCGVALYGLSPFGEDPAADGLEPALSWRSYLAQVKRLEPGESTRLRAALRRRAADLDRDRAGRLRGRLPPRPDRHRGAGRRRAAARGRHRLDGRLRGRARPRGAGRRAGDDPRPRRPGGGARARGRDDQLRARLRDRRRTRGGRGGRWSMLEAAQEVLAGEEAWVVGGAVRDELLGRPSWSISTSPAATRSAPRAPTPKRSGGAPFPLSERHGAWRVALADGRTVDFTPLPGLDRGRPRDARLHDQRDRPAARGRGAGRPLRRAGRSGGAAAARRSARASFATTRCGCCARCGSRTSSTCGSTTRPSGSCASTPRSSARRRASGSWPSCGASRPPATAGSTSSGCWSRSAGRIDDRLERWSTRPTTGSSRSSATSCAGSRSRTSCGATRRRCCGPSRRRTIAALDPPLPPRDRAVGAGGARLPRRRPSWRRPIERARSGDPAEPLLRGDELGLPPGPEIGRLLARDRGGAGRGYDRHEGGGARLCKTPARERFGEDS